MSFQDYAHLMGFFYSILPKLDNKKTWYFINTKLVQFY